MLRIFMCGVLMVMFAGCAADKAVEHSQLETYSLEEEKKYSLNLHQDALKMAIDQLEGELNSGQ